MALVADLLAACQLLTRLPLGPLAGRAAGDASRVVWAYPVVGGLVGCAGAAAYWACWHLAMGPALASLWTTASLILLTGGLHEDGLADTADGFGGGRTVERKLAIMRDSSLGAFGVLALLLAIGIRVAAPARIGEPAAVWRALTVAAALGRGAMLLPVLLSRPARPDGLAAALAPAAAGPIAAGLLLAIGVAATLEPPGLAAASVGLAAAAGLLGARLARRQLGGYTGDVLGATEIAAECAVLTALSASW